jgi:signal transduction histidine kinase
MITSAERGELPMNPTLLNSVAVLEEAVVFFVKSEVLVAKSILIDPSAEDVPFTSDNVILRRVLCNLVKNALEASEAGDFVTLGCSRLGNRVEFWVRNAGAMPEAVQMQIFKRSFSTKGPGRGIGTYSIKLLSEYLKGDVTFSSNSETGTIFKVNYPLELAQE